MAEDMEKKNQQSGQPGQGQQSGQSGQQGQGQHGQQSGQPGQHSGQQHNAQRELDLRRGRDEFLQLDKTVENREGDDVRECRRGATGSGRRYW